MTASFDDSKLFIDGKQYELEHVISYVADCGDTVVVLFDPDGSIEASGQFHNLVGVGRSGQRMWVAELPTSNPGDRYYRIALKRPLTAYSTQSYDCVIDLNTGRIQDKSSTK